MLERNALDFPAPTRTNARHAWQGAAAYVSWMRVRKDKRGYIQRRGTKTVYFRNFGMTLRALNDKPWHREAAHLGSEGGPS